MQDIAAEMNLSETAFVVPRASGDYDLRWFTPTTEVNLCGHATLASAHVVGTPAVFHTRSGPLGCESGAPRILMDFPASPIQEEALPLVPPWLPEPAWTGLAGEDWLVELPSADEVVDLEAAPSDVSALGRRALIVTARGSAGSGYDIVSRFFAPNAGIPEDPVTGSAHCALAPYWGPRLGIEELIGYQASRRGGVVHMTLKGSRVVLGGEAVTVSEVSLLA